MAYRRSTDTASCGDSVITESDGRGGGGGVGGRHETYTNNGAFINERIAVAAAINYYGPPIEVTVRSPVLFPGRELRISCMERDTVAELKEEIRSKWGVYVRDDIKLYRSPAGAGAEGGRPVEMVDDDAALSEYSVKDGTVVEAEYSRADGWERLRKY